MNEHAKRIEELGQALDDLVSAIQDLSQAVELLHRRLTGVRYALRLTLANRPGEALRILDRTGSVDDDTNG